MSIIHIIEPQAKLLFAVDATPTRLALHVFKPAEAPPPPASNETKPDGKIDKKVKTVTKGNAPSEAPALEAPSFNTFIHAIDKKFLGQHFAGAWTLIKGAPVESGYVVYQGSSAFILDGNLGEDEWTDYTLLECPYTSQFTPGPWRNRFALTAIGRINRSFRWRQLQNEGTLAALFVPFAGKSLLDSRLELLTAYKPVMIQGRLDDSLHEREIPKDGLWWKNFYWHVRQEGPVKIAKDGTTDIPVRLLWNKGDKPCANAAVLKVEADAGYVPMRRIVFDKDGRAKVRVSALGLLPGEKIRLKFSAGSFTNVGTVEVTVA